MTKVFVGGSRRIGRLCPEVSQRLDRIIERRLAVLVGDASGADRAVQEYLRGKRYDLVEVFCSGDSCRNNTGHWPVRTIQVKRKRRDFAFHATKDRAMAEEASVGFMLWDKESVGTLMNVLRLVRRHKKVVLFVAPDRQFIDVKDDDDWARLLASCGRELRERVERESSAEVGPRAAKQRPPSQASLF